VLATPVALNVNVVPVFNVTTAFGVPANDKAADEPKQIVLVPEILAVGLPTETVAIPDPAVEQ